jgi:DNA-binding NarL/FixJ family response regulator
MMPGASVLPIVDAAYDLSADLPATISAIARAAARAVGCGPIAVVPVDPDARFDPAAVRFERAEPHYVARFLDWQQQMSVATRRSLMALSARAIRVRPEAHDEGPAELSTITCDVSSLYVLANTGAGGGLHIAFNHPDRREWQLARLRRFHGIARHLATAWRLRTAMTRAGVPPIAAELRGDGTSELAPSASTGSARDALRRGVLAQERARTRCADGCELWPALVAGRWSLLDAFTAGGMRYIVAYENPVEPAPLRALAPREQRILELALAGRAGKWIALELEMSESAVTRTLRGALHRIGAIDTTALAGVRTARFTALEVSGVDLAVARLPATAVPRASLSGAEQAIVSSVLDGKRIAAIAVERGTSARTVSHQIVSVYRKLGISSRRELVAFFT